MFDAAKVVDNLMHTKRIPLQIVREIPKDERKVRDSNPRYPKGVYRISSPARSITLPTFLFLFCGCKGITII